jgi:hypothetical protein
MRSLATAAAAIALAGCSVEAPQPLGPGDPQFVKAMDAAQDYAAGYYHLNRNMCGAAAGFHFGAQKRGDRVAVTVEPAKPRTDAILLTFRASDMKVVATRPFTSGSLPPSGWF